MTVAASGAELIYRYADPVEGRLLQRYKRFFADVELTTGEIITAHCPNTGPMSGVCELGARVLLSHNPSPKRKLAYTWEAIEVAGSAGQPVWVGVNTNLPNRVVKELLNRRLIPALDSYETVRSEVKYGTNSRVDFLLAGTESGKLIYVEVKNTTWTDGTLAKFPDTVTERGQKHLREMAALLPDAAAVMLYFINREDCDRFAPGDDRDPTYGQLLRSAIAQGMEVLPCRFAVSPEGLRFLGLATSDF
ncbi:MAG: DNA/RNA nuclease SfsA [Oscillatoriales cyanobacterium]|nr:MAG: DNA/RNA nuclease SfsA [Oscillatoriales cyanobacterium]